MRAPLYAEPRDATTIAGRDRLRRLAVICCTGGVALAFAAPAHADDAPAPTDVTVETVNQAVQTAEATAASLQIDASNTNISVRVDSPGSDGSVTQTNTTAAQSASSNQSSASTESPANAPVSQSDTTVAAASTAASATQVQPQNMNISVRVQSPGDNGPVTQTNSAQAQSSATTAAEVVQSVVDTAAPTSSATAVPEAGQYQSPATQYQAGQGSNETVSSNSPPNISEPSWNWTWNWSWNCSAPVAGSWILSLQQQALNWNWNWDWISSCMPGGTGEILPQPPLPPAPPSPPRPSADPQYQLPVPQYQAAPVEVAPAIAAEVAEAVGEELASVIGTPFVPPSDVLTPGTLATLGNFGLSAIAAWTGGRTNTTFTSSVSVSGAAIRVTPAGVGERRDQKPPDDRGPGPRGPRDQSAGFAPISSGGHGGMSLLWFLAAAALAFVISNRPGVRIRPDRDGPPPLPRPDARDKPG